MLNYVQDHSFLLKSVCYFAILEEPPRGTFSLCCWTFHLAKTMPKDLLTPRGGSMPGFAAETPNEWNQRCPLPNVVMQPSSTKGCRLCRSELSVKWWPEWENPWLVVRRQDGEWEEGSWKHEDFVTWDLLRVVWVGSAGCLWPSYNSFEN